MTTFNPDRTKKYVEAMLDAGLNVSGVEITKDGNLRILSGVTAFSPSNNTADDDDDAEYREWLSNGN